MFIINIEPNNMLNTLKQTPHRPNYARHSKGALNHGTQLSLQMGTDRHQPFKIPTLLVQFHGGNWRNKMDS